MAVTTGAGVLVGVLRRWFRLPAKLPGTVQELVDQRVEFARHLSDSGAQTLASEEPAHARARALSTTEPSKGSTNASGRRSTTSRSAKHTRSNASPETPNANAQTLKTAISASGRPTTSSTPSGSSSATAAKNASSLQRTYVDGLDSETLQAIGNERAGNDPVAWIDDRANDIRYLRALEQELLERDRRAERQLVVAAQIDPPEHIAAVLGPRPDNHATRSAWERGVAAIETSATTTTSPPDHHTSALGAAPDRMHPNPAFRDAESAVRQARAEVGLEHARSTPNVPHGPIASASHPSARSASAATMASTPTCDRSTPARHWREFPAADVQPIETPSP